LPLGHLSSRQVYKPHLQYPGLPTSRNVIARAVIEFINASPVRLVLGQQGSCSTEVWTAYHTREENQPYSRKPCAVDSVVIINPTNMGITKGASVTSVLSASIPLLIPLTRFTIDDSSRKRFTRFSNRTLDGSSLRGGSEQWAS